MRIHLKRYLGNCCYISYEWKRYSVIILWPKDNSLFTAFYFLIFLTNVKSSYHKFILIDLWVKQSMI